MSRRPGLARREERLRVYFEGVESDEKLAKRAAWLAASEDWDYAFTSFPRQTYDQKLAEWKRRKEWNRIWSASRPRRIMGLRPKPKSP